jgi:hypothetical protein
MNYNLTLGSRTAKLEKKNGKELKRIEEVEQKNEQLIKKVEQLEKQANHEKNQQTY